MSRKNLMASAAAFIVLTGMQAGAAHAELVVVEQSGTGYKADQKVSEGAALNVPAGAHVKFKRLPDGVDVVVDGPYDGTISNYRGKGPCPWWNPVCKTDKDLSRGAAPGVTRGPVPAPGATRGME